MTYPILFLGLLFTVLSACAVGKAEPAPASRPGEDNSLPLPDGMEPAKYPAIAECLGKHMQPWVPGEVHRDFVVSLKTTVLPFDLRVAPAHLLNVEPFKLCALVVMGELKPDTIMFATGVRFYPAHAPSTIPLVTGALTPLQVREGIMTNQFHKCMTQKQNENRLHGAALLKGEITNGVLQNPRLESSTFQDVEYETCIVSKMQDLQFHSLPEPSILAFPLSMRVSDLDPN